MAESRPSEATRGGNERNNAAPTTAVTQLRDQIRSALSGESAILDMDSILSRLEDLDLELGALKSGAEEGAVLREDMIGRIHSMERAIVAADPKQAPLNESLFVETLSAAELVRSYRKLCGRFRDTFGGSLRYLPQEVAKRVSTKSQTAYADYQS